MRYLSKSDYRDTNETESSRDKPETISESNRIQMRLDSTEQNTIKRTNMASADNKKQPYFAFLFAHLKKKYYLCAAI